MHDHATNDKIMLNNNIFDMKLEKDEGRPNATYIC